MAHSHPTGRQQTVGKLSVLGRCVCVFGKGVISWAFLVKDNSQGKVSSMHLILPEAGAWTPPPGVGSASIFYDGLLRRRCSSSDNQFYTDTEPLILISSLTAQISCKERGLRRNWPLPESLTFLVLAWGLGSVLSRAQQVRPLRNGLGKSGLPCPANILGGGALDPPLALVPLA